VKVTDDPLSPTTLAVRVLTPATLPRV
jgi:hypothetical protein